MCSSIISGRFNEEGVFRLFSREQYVKTESTKFDNKRTIGMKVVLRDMNIQQWKELGEYGVLTKRKIIFLSGV